MPPPIGTHSILALLMIFSQIDWVWSRIHPCLNPFLTSNHCYTTLHNVLFVTSWPPFTQGLNLLHIKLTAPQVYICVAYYFSVHWMPTRSLFFMRTWGRSTVCLAAVQSSRSLTVSNRTEPTGLSNNSILSRKW